MTEVLARLSGIERRFGSVLALDGAELEVRPGEVHGLLGANGAGKSTLLNVLGGMLRPDAGTLEVSGEAATFTSPRDAWAHGIALVHQHFTLVPRLSVLENLSLGLRRGLTPDTVREAAEAIMERTGLRVPWNATIESLGVGDRQRIEILKALLREPTVLVLDEPTAVLTPPEAEGLFELLSDWAGEGRAVLLVAHKLDEVLAVSDRITVLRVGRTVLSGRSGEFSPEELIRAMVGEATTRDRGAQSPGAESPDSVPTARAVNEAGEVADADLVEVVAALHGVTYADERGERLSHVDLTVRRGEVLGIAGVEGNGQHELALLLAGVSPPTSGLAELPEGIGFIPQDRSTEGLVKSFDLTENVALALHRSPAHHEGVWLRWDAVREAAEGIRERFDVAAPSVRTLGSALSGGNQQRVVVGREVSMASDLLVAENPTRGLDIAATNFVRQELRGLAASGVAVVLISTDLDEIIELSDRVLAIARGRLIKVPPDRRTREGIGALMLGGSDS